LPWTARRCLTLGTLATGLGLATLAGCGTSPLSEQPVYQRWSRTDTRLYDGRYEGRHESATERRPSPSANNAFALPDDPSLRDYFRYAMAHNPGLQAAFQQWKAALERIPQARSLPDPRLSYTYFIRESMTQQSVGLSQTFPWYRKLKARARAKLEAARAAEQRFERQRLSLLADVKAAHAEYAYLRQALAVLKENRRIRREMVAAARAQFEADAVPYADIARAEVAVEQLNDEIASLKDRRPTVVARLNAALGRSSDRSLPWPDALPQPAIEPGRQQLLARLEKQNPELRALGHDVARQRALLGLARQNRIPDFHLGVRYLEMVPEDLRNQVALTASINLPIWDKRLEAERAEALAEFGAATRERRDRENELESKLQLAFYRFRDAQRQVALFEDRLIPKAREALETTEAAYAAGETPFASLAQAQADLQQMQLSHERALADSVQHLAELERLLGEELDGEATGPEDSVESGGAGDSGESNETAGDDADATETDQESESG